MRVECGAFKTKSGSSKASREIEHALSTAAGGFAQRKTTEHVLNSAIDSAYFPTTVPPRGICLRLGN